MALTALSNSIRVISAKSVLDSVSTSNYYLGIGRVKPWVPTADSPSASDIAPPNEILTNDTINEVWDNAIGLKNALSRKIDVDNSETALSFPPMTPANASGPS